MKRYEIWINGFVTNYKYVKVFECNLHKRLLRHLKIWETSHGYDHKIKIIDTKKDEITVVN